MARSKTIHVIPVEKLKDVGSMPAFLELCHRHFQKSRPSIKSDVEATLVAPLDLLDLIVPEKLLSPIESLEIVYRKGAK